MHKTRYAILPYPLCAARINIAIAPTSLLCWLPRGRVNWKMPERMREQGETIWWGRWLIFQIEYCRWV